MTGGLSTLRLATAFLAVVLAGAELEAAPIAGAQAESQSPTSEPSAGAELKDSWESLVAASVAVVMSERLKPATCRWCDVDASGHDALNAFDRVVRDRFLWKGPAARRAGVISDILQGTMWVLPVVLVATSPNPSWTDHDRWDAVRLMLWTHAANTTVTSVIKQSAARARPFVHFKNLDAAQGPAPNSSFVSGHASSTFTAVVGSIAICRELACGHEGRLWAVGVPLASLTGYLRIAADAHYATDVLAGAGLGVALGGTIPRVAHEGGQPAPAAVPLRARPYPRVTVVWTW